MSNELEAGKIIGKKKLPPLKIENEEQALNYLEKITNQMIISRNQCMIAMPGDKKTTAKLQSKAFTAFLIHHGSVLGTVVALHATGLIQDKAYMEFRQKALNTLAGFTSGLI